MKSLHISFQRVVDAGLFNGIKVGASTQIYHLFYVDDAIFMGQWNQLNIDSLTRVPEVFHRASGLRINMNKSKLMGISVDPRKVDQAATKIGCMILKMPFKYLGSRVGDPMSRIASWNEVIDSLFNGIKVGASTQIYHLFYVDDAIFMGQWNQLNIDSLTRVPEVFHHASGLRINMNKSKLMGISVDPRKVDQAATKIGCLILKMPFKYLGSRVGDPMSRIALWNEVIDSMLIRLSRWKLKTLSICGRFTLLKAVLGVIPIYHMSLFKVPLQVLRNMESIRARFFNGIDTKSKKLSWVRWTNVMASKNNSALLFQSLEMGGIHRSGTLFGVKIMKDISLESKLSHEDLEFSLPRTPRGDREQVQLEKLIDCLEGCSLRDLNDRWSWSINGLCDFSVASVRKVIDDNNLPKSMSKTRWVKVVPIKVNVHAWKVQTDGLPTRFNLSRRADPS
nr:RNA-directed DNA polymerase, eukaryota, reverse transcriptase zinc-binding domain protein [Tanacetum cinerariifolium]